MNAIDTISLFLGLGLFALIGARLLNWFPLRITKRVEPKDVRISPELLADYRREIQVYAAVNSVRSLSTPATKGFSKDRKVVSHVAR